MSLKDIIKFQLKRVNPFQGLVIDADIWRDAHNYHRDQQRLHVLTFHKTGIVEGLQVTANNPADLSVNIHPGTAIDPATGERQEATTRISIPSNSLLCSHQHEIIVEE